MLMMMTMMMRRWILLRKSSVDRANGFRRVFRMAFLFMRGYSVIYPVLAWSLILIILSARLWRTHIHENAHHLISRGANEKMKSDAAADFVPIGLWAYMFSKASMNPIATIWVKHFRATILLRRRWRNERDAVAVTLAGSENIREWRFFLGSDFGIGLSR